MARIDVFRDHEQLVEAAAKHIASLAAQAIAARGCFTLALSGGSTPQPVYARLAAAGDAWAIDWSKLQLLFSDERCVPPGDPRSNYAMVKRELLDRVPLPQANVHRMRGEDDPQRAAQDYEAVLRQVLGVAAEHVPAAGFDLVLLGLGENGHAASLFPGLPAVFEQRRGVMAQYVEAEGMWRITLTPVVINAARQVAFLVSGAAKAATLRSVIEGPHQPALLPAQIVAPTHGELRWLVDAAAAAKLSRPMRQDRRDFMRGR